MVAGSARRASEGRDEGADPVGVTAGRDTQDESGVQDELKVGRGWLESNWQQAWARLRVELVRGGLGGESAFPGIEGGQGDGLDGAELSGRQAGEGEASESIQPDLTGEGPRASGAAGLGHSSDGFRHRFRGNDEFRHRNTSKGSGDPSKVTSSSIT